MQFLRFQSKFQKMKYHANNIATKFIIRIIGKKIVLRYLLIRIKYEIQQ